jgi:hypothetical protein
MLDGPYAEVDTSTAPSTTQARTGTISLGAAGPNNAGQHWRRVLAAARTKAGVGMALYPTVLPNLNNNWAPIEFRDAANASQVSIVIQSTGAVAAFRGAPNSGTLLGTSSTLMTAGAWSHLEAAVLFSQTVGTVEVRLNGVTILNLTGIDTVATALVECSQVCGRAVSGDASAEAFVDDLYCWNDLGSQNNNFVGDQKVYTTYPNADTAENDWTPNSGAVGFDRIDETVPDDDTTYVEAASIPESGQAVSEYGLEDLPAEVSAISGIQTYGLLRKTDAGDCTVMQSMLSGSSVADGAQNPLTTAYTYYPTMFETDPATAAPWTRTGFNAAFLRVTRTV